MSRAVEFYRKLGFQQNHSSPDFATFVAGSGYLNLVRASDETEWSWWGRVIFHVDDVDAHYERALAAGLEPEAPPRDAPWGERYFHVIDPDGHELSFARRLACSRPEEPIPLP
jgi:catechol 2,3-dioxygenase-like lactoylglutathione lyase family enzyme